MKNGLKGKLPPLVVWAFVTPFLLLSLFSNAVMPVMSADGPVLVICTGEGPLEMVIDPDTGEAVPKPSGDSPGKCSWAGANGPVMLSAPFATPLVVERPISAALTAHSTILAVARATGLPPSTGPPVRF